MLPHLGEIVDDICLIKSMKTDQFNPCARTDFSEHRLLTTRPAQSRLVGDLRVGQRIAGPACVCGHVHRLGISGGSANWSSGFMPSFYAGVRFRNQGDPILDVSSPNGIDAKLQRDSLDLIES
jgi:hypothetical protein